MTFLVSATERASIIKLVVAMFNAAPGATYLAELVTSFEANGRSLSKLAGDLGNSTAYKTLNPVFQTAAEFATTFLKPLGLQANTEAIDFVTSKLNAGVSKGQIAYDAATALNAYTGTNAELIAAKAILSNKAAVAEYYSVTKGVAQTDITVLQAALAGVTSSVDTVVASKVSMDGTDSSSASVTLTTGADNLAGTTGNDVFEARILDNSNTLQSGDKINGGAGNDRLNADIGASQKFAITAETTGVETVAIRAQAEQNDSGDNNIAAPGVGQIDAQRMVGVTQWESNNSRADVVIEDVRILDSQITKDITIAMVETDPGHVDFGVYFDQHSLRAQSNTSATLSLELMDTRSSAAGTGPLLNNPYNGFGFYLTAAGSTERKAIFVHSQAIDDAQTYVQLKDAIAAAVKAMPELANFTVELGGEFQVADTLGSIQIGRTITLTSNAGDSVSDVGPLAGWVANGILPPSSGLHTNMDTVASSATDLVTSKIILDDVGRGSTSGDLVVGGLSVGDTSSSQGVQRFEIEVRDNSKLETINSTNNTLREVTIKNGVTTSSSYAYGTTVKDAGNLTVNGVSGANGANVTNGGTVDAQNGVNTPLPGSAAQTAHNFGFSDVRLIDASAFKGQLAFSAEVTDASIAKYLNLTDIQALAKGDNIDFSYTGGLNNDSMFIHLDGTAAASRNTITAGREDFTFTANGGDGNDSITVQMVTGLTGVSEAWYANQKLNANVFVNGGAGDDTIKTPGAGDVIIDGGAGNDTVYADNTGAKAVYVFNTANQLVGPAIERTQDDLKSDVNDLINLYKGKLSVGFMGLTATVDVDSTGYKTSDLQINQAIKNAINHDAVLSKLLVATDGPANTLVVTSLIDGLHASTDLSVTVSAPAAIALSTADVAAAAAAWALPVGTTAADLLAATDVSIAAFNLKGDYVSQFAQTPFALTDIAGEASLSSSDNTITGGAGNDVIVLGTTVGADSMLSSNDKVVFGAGFGNDVIVNFTVTGFESDTLDFTALKGSAAEFGNMTADKSIFLEATTAANDTVAEVQALFLDGATASSHVYIAYAGEVGTVYSITDTAGVAAGSVTASLVGTIDLAGADWSLLTAANFA